MTRDASKCAVGQALYGCFCEDDGAVIQDGTVFRLGENHFRFNLADPALRWLKLNATGMDVSIEEVSKQIAALALQGPNALKILHGLIDAEIGGLRFFRLANGNILDVPVIVSRTGYTGDLGYEVWFGAEHAERIWDLIMERGKIFGIKPAGMLALDVARLEAGFILLEVDYIGADKAMIASQRYSPFEISLGWTVDLKKSHFVGHRALKEISANGPSRQIVGLEVSLSGFEYLYNQLGLPPHYPLAAWRGGVPVYQDDRQVGHATTGAWSPTLKKYIALATVERAFARPGTILNMEATIEYQRKTTSVTVVKIPFFDPPRKRAVIASPNGR
jgi:aminomethyltransferase